MSLAVEHLAKLLRPMVERIRRGLHELNVEPEEIARMEAEELLRLLPRLWDVPPEPSEGATGRLRQLQSQHFNAGCGISPTAEGWREAFHLSDAIARDALDFAQELLGTVSRARAPGEEQIMKLGLQQVRCPVCGSERNASEPRCLNVGCTSHVSSEPRAPGAPVASPTGSWWVGPGIDLRHDTFVISEAWEEEKASWRRLSERLQAENSTLRAASSDDRALRETPSDAQMRAALEAWPNDLPLPSESELAAIVRAANHAEWPDGARAAPSAPPQ